MSNIQFFNDIQYTCKYIEFKCKHWFKMSSKLFHIFINPKNCWHSEKKKNMKTLFFFNVEMHLYHRSVKLKTTKQWPNYLLSLFAIPRQMVKNTSKNSAVGVLMQSPSRCMIDGGSHVCYSFPPVTNMTAFLFGQFSTHKSWCCGWMVALGVSSIFVWDSKPWAKPSKSTP